MNILIPAALLALVLAGLRIRLQWIQPPDTIGSYVTEGTLIHMQNRLNRKGTMSLEPETL